ncbi:MAG: flagellar hook-basal body complex protein FliE [Burkholderiales bacterium]|nr:flagellar hook-basal body complex protein FliE [Burkholderiales bacterium]
MQTRALDEILSQLRAAEAFASGRAAAGAAARADAASGADFAAALKSALDTVNGAQNRALALARDFETGNRDVALHEVMLAMQKANIAFQGTVQVRNRLVAAYQDIMNMPI